MASWLAGDFVGRAIPSMDAYCEQRVSLSRLSKCYCRVYGCVLTNGEQYGKQWENVRKKVPYKLLPLIY